MKKVLSLILSLLLAMSVVGCSQTETAPEESDTTPEVQQPEVPDEEESTEPEIPPLQWAEDIPALFYEPDWTVETTSEEFLLELTDPKYQGRATGSAGNRAAADWIESQFIRMGLQPLPDLDSYRLSYQDDEIYEILPGYAAVVNADGTETELELGVDWGFRPSYEKADLTLPLSADLTDCEAGTAFLNGDLTKQKVPRNYIEIVSGDVASGIPYINRNGSASQITLTQEVYDQLTQDGGKFHLKLPVAVQEGEADNVIAYLPGVDSKKAVVIGANFDGHGQCGTAMVSAYNNASGVAAMLQTASWLSRAEQLPCDVIFAAFNSGQTGLAGSRALSTQIYNEYDQILMINLKCVGWKDQPLTVYGEKKQSSLRNDLAAALEIQYRERSFGSDDVSFNVNNMLAVSIFQDACLENDAIFSTLSTIYDTPDNLDPAMLDELAKSLCTWVIERGGNTISEFYKVIW